MRLSTGTRSSLSIRRALLEINLQLEDILTWSDRNGFSDPSSTISYRIESSNFPNVVRDILLLEDRYYFSHRGAELRAIPRGLKRYWKFGKFGGVSTIEQQLIRTLCNRRQRTFGRKSREVLLAILLNLHRTKRELLLAYLNCAYFGPKMHGVDAASRVVFGVNAVRLSDSQSSFIACLLPYPLPPKMSLWLRKNGSVSTPDAVLDHYLVSDSWWANRVRKRMTYLDNLRSKV